LTVASGNVLLLCAESAKVKSVAAANIPYFINFILSDFIKFDALKIAA
jgi:hypothetical protein